MSSFRRRVESFVIAAVVLGAFAAPMARADEGEHGEDKAAGKVPATLDGIWHECMEHQARLESSIKSKTLSKVHEDAFRIRDLVAAMVEKSASLPAAKLEKVKTNAKFLATLAGRLDESGDAGDQAGTEAAYAKFSDVLKAIEAQYPPETLKHKGASEHGG